MGGLRILIVMILLSLSSPRRDMAGHHGPVLPAQLVAGRGPTLTCEATEDDAEGDEVRCLGWVRAQGNGRGEMWECAV